MPIQKERKHHGRFGMFFVVVGRKNHEKKTNFAEQLKEYMTNRTSEQIREDVENLLENGYNFFGF